MIEEETVGKLGGGGFEGLLSRLRESQLPNLKRKALKEFFDACLPATMKQLPDYIHHVYMLLDPLSTMDLIRLVEHYINSLTDNSDSELRAGLTSSLKYLTSKHESLAIQPGRLQSLLKIPEEQWSTPPSERPHDYPCRRLRLQTLRREWRQSHQNPAKLIRKVRFSVSATAETSGTEEYVTAPETMPTRESVERTSSSESREEWHTAPDIPDELFERGKNVAGLLREE